MLGAGVSKADANAKLHGRETHDIADNGVRGLVETDSAHHVKIRGLAFCDQPLGTPCVGFLEPR